MKYIKYFWANMTSYKTWNARYSHLPYAQLTPAPLKTRLRRSIKFTTYKVREDLARWIAPWYVYEDEK